MGEWKGELDPAPFGRLRWTVTFDVPFDPDGYTSCDGDEAPIMVAADAAQLEQMWVEDHDAVSLLEALDVRVDQGTPVSVRVTHVEGATGG